MAGRVEFHTGVPDTLDFACRLLRKAYRRGTTVLCLAPPEQLEVLDRALWTFVEREFLPHAMMGRAPRRVLERTPIWIAASMPLSGAAAGVVADGGAIAVADGRADGRTEPPNEGPGEPAAPPSRRDVIVNLGGELPVQAAASARVIEVVGADAVEVERGRALWRQYKAEGFEITHHPFKAAGED